MFGADIWCQASGLDCSKGIRAHGAECLSVRITLLHPSEELLSIAQHKEVRAHNHTRSRPDIAQTQTYASMYTLYACS